jgi:dienelactone hydrolase
VVVLVAAGVATTSLLSGADGSADARRAAASPGASTVAPTGTAPVEAPASTEAPTTTTLPDGAGRHAVGTYAVDYVDTSRSTAANGSFPGADSRTIPTTFWFPALTDGGDPDRAHGPYPVVLFAHGYAQTPEFYRPLLERWASAGYVVVAPTFPLVSGIPGGASHVEFTKVYGDASFVITQALASGSDTPIGGLLDRTRLALAGHSDGEMVSFTLGFAACCRDPRVRAVIAMAGDLSYADIEPIQNSGLPILHVMETNDEYDPYPHSIEWDRAHLTPPRWMLTLQGATHVPPYNRPGDPHFELVTDVTIEFLDGTLKGRTDRLDAVGADVAAHPDLAALER